MKINIGSDEASQQDFPKQFRAFGQPAFGAAMGQFDVIIGAAQDRQVHAGEHRQENIMVPQIGPKDDRDQDRCQDENSAHRGRPLLGVLELVEVGGVVAFGDLADLELFELADEPRRQNNAQNKRRQAGHRGAKGDVTKMLNPKKHPATGTNNRTP